jgi:hypothetical protein
MSACCLPDAALSLGSFFYPEDGSDMVLRHIIYIRGYISRETALFIMTAV